ncbi:hypothetical protein BGZ76_008716 [Entomortierella beljakovae]|nr:hypothetical protein BGZ76_008716 [Entomortierella beljakovae]
MNRSGFAYKLGKDIQIDNQYAAEYWKSNAKFWCRFCKIYITDNKSTRNIHDSGIKHKENVERFLREQNQRSRDKEFETARLNKEMEAIERAAMKGFQKDIEDGLAQPSASYKKSTPASIPSYSVPGIPASELSSSEPSSDTKPESAGKDSGESEGKAETTETTGKIERSENVGQPGEWETVIAPVPRVVSRLERGKGRNESDDTNENGKHYIVGADDEDDAADPEDLREFKIVEKTYPVETEIPGKDGKADDGEPVVFKKRKTDAGKSRNIRRKV